MTTEPKRVGLTDDDRTALRDLICEALGWDCRHYDKSLNDCEEVRDAILAAGWASPEEAAAREATARREALLEYREALDSQDPDVLLTWPNVRDDVTSWIHDILADGVKWEGMQ